MRSQQQNQFPEAARLYKRLLALKPGHAEAHNNLGRVLRAQGKLNEASAHFAQALSLMPQLFDQFSGVCATLVAVLPPIGDAMRRASAAWPTRLTLEQLLGSAGHGLKLIGFEFDQAILQQYRALFSQNGWSMSDLDRWHAVETKYPDSFSGMYQLWTQKM